MPKRVPIRSSLRREPSRFNTGSVPQRSHAETEQLHAELYDRHRRSPYGDPAVLKRLAEQLLTVALRGRTLPASLRAAVAACARELVAGEADLFRLPELPPTTSIVQSVETRAIIRARLTLFDNPKLIDHWLTALARCLASILDALPAIDPSPSPLSIPTPIINLIQSPTEVVRHILTNLVPLSPHPQATCDLPGGNLAATIIDNLLVASRMTFDIAQRHPERLKWPGSDRATPSEIVNRYLVNTPFAALLDAAIPLPIPASVLYEHQHVMAAWGHGKTQLLQRLILSYLDDPRRPSIIFIDSQGDAIRLLSRLSRFDPARSDDLTILDFGDTEYPLRVNLFDVHRDRINKLDIGTREEVLAGLVELYDFVFATLLGSELTGKQGMAFRFLAQLMITIPGANIRTMRALLTDPTPYLHHLDELEDDAREFLQNHFFANDPEYRGTHREVLRRLFQVASISPSFNRMFTAEKNAIDFKRAMETPGKVVLINTSKARLKAEASSIAGRFCIAAIAQATLERAAEPEHTRHPCFLLIDEAHEYVDHESEMLKTMLFSARKYCVSMTLSHHDLSQAKSRALRSAIMSMATRFVGAVPTSDALALAPGMHTTPEFLGSVRKTATAADFSCFVRNVTPSATRFTLPYFAAENEPKMSDAAYANLLARIRAQVATPLSAAHPKPRSRTITPQSPDDDFGERY